MKKISTLLAILLIATMAGCSNTAKAESIEATHQPTTQEISVNTTNHELDEIKINNIDKMASSFKYAYGNVYYMVQFRETIKIVSTDPSTGESTDINLLNVENHMYTDYDVTSDSIWALSVPLKGSGSSTIYRFDLQGNQISSFEAQGQPTNMAVDNNGNVVLNYENALIGKDNETIIFDENGNEKNRFTTNIYPSFLKSNDGSIHTISYLDDEIKLQKINTETCEPEKSNLQDAISSLDIDILINGNGKFAFYALQMDGIMAFNTLTNNLDKIVDFEKENINVEDINDVIPVNDETICVVFYGENDEAPTIQNINI